MREIITNYLDSLKKAISEIDIAAVENLIAILKNAKDRNSTVYIMGNGGSSATASHFVCDIAKGIESGEKRFKVICLNDNFASVTAYANDMSYDEIFSEQLKIFAQPDDVVIGISSSGNSKNILKAIEYANSRNCITVGLTGSNGGELKKISQHSFHIETKKNELQIAEDLQLSVIHIIMKVLQNLEQSV